MESRPGQGIVRSEEIRELLPETRTYDEINWQPLAESRTLTTLRFEHDISDVKDVNWIAKSKSIKVLDLRGLRHGADSIDAAELPFLKDMAQLRQLIVVSARDPSTIRLPKLVTLIVKPWDAKYSWLDE